MTHSAKLIARMSLLALLLTAAPAVGHEPLRTQIDHLTRRIETEAPDPGLYLARAELLRLNGQPQLAEADLQRAEKLLPGSPLVDLTRARMLRDAGRLVAAEERLDAVLAGDHSRHEALALRADVRNRLGRSDDAIADYDAAVTAARRACPDLYLERARLLATLGPAGVDRAIASLDAGLRRWGTSPALEDLAVDLELRQGRPDAALERLDRMVARTPRLAPLLARRGDVLAAAGRTIESWAAYSDALAALEALPAARRRAATLVALESHLRSALSTLTTEPNLTNTRNIR